MVSWTVILTELLGTGLLVIFGNGVVANVILKGTKGNGGGWVSISLGWGLAVFIGAIIASALGGPAHLNPAVTLAIAFSHIHDKANMLGYGNISAATAWLTFILVMVAQFIGAMVGQVILDIVYLKHIHLQLGENAEGSKGNVLGMHSTGPTTRNELLNFLMEFVGAAVLVLAILSFGKIAYLPMYVGPILCALVVMGVGFSLGGTTGYSVNPARDLGPRIIHQLMPFKGKGKSDWAYSWVPVAAPAAAGVIVGLFFLI